MKKSLRILLFIMGGLAIASGLYLAVKKDLINLGNRDEAATDVNVEDQSDEEFDSWVVPCTSTSESVVETVPAEYVGRVYVAEIPDDYLTYSMLDSSDRRTFSIADFDNVPENEPPYSAFVHFETADSSNVTGIEADIQLCDENNMSSHGLAQEISAANEERSGVTSYIHGAQFYIPEDPGDYRMDGYVYYDDSWHLIGQIDLVFTE